MASCNIYSSATLETFSLVTGSNALGGTTNFKAFLNGIIYENTSGSTAWVQIWDGFAQPANGAVPTLSLKLPATSQGSFGDSVIFNFPVKNGIVVTLSSTGPTYTPITSSLFITAWWSY